MVKNINKYVGNIEGLYKECAGLVAEEVRNNRKSSDDSDKSDSDSDSEQGVNPLYVI